MAECCIDHIDTSISSCALSQLPGQGMTKLLNLNDCFDEIVEQHVTRTKMLAEPSAVSHKHLIG